MPSAHHGGAGDNTLTGKVLGVPGLTPHGPLRRHSPYAVSSTCETVHCSKKTKDFDRAPFLLSEGTVNVRLRQISRTCALMVSLLLLGVIPVSAQETSVPSPVERSFRGALTFDQTTPTANVQASQSATSPATVSCSSEAGRRTVCPANTSAGVALMKATGTGACLLGKTWGYDDKGIWVSDGCGGVFALGQVTPVAGSPQTPPPPATGASQPAEPTETNRERGACSIPARDSWSAAAPGGELAISALRAGAVHESDARRADLHGSSGRSRNVHGRP